MRKRSDKKAPMPDSRLPASTCPRIPFPERPHQVRHLQRARGEDDWRREQEREPGGVGPLQAAEHAGDHGDAVPADAGQQGQDLCRSDQHGAPVAHRGDLAVGSDRLFLCQHLVLLAGMAARCRAGRSASARFRTDHVGTGRARRHHGCHRRSRWDRPERTRRTRRDRSGDELTAGSRVHRRVADCCFAASSLAGGSVAGRGRREDRIVGS